MCLSSCPDRPESDDSFDVFKTYRSNTLPAPFQDTGDSPPSTDASSSSLTLTLNSTSTASSSHGPLSSNNSSVSVDDLPAPAETTPSTPHPAGLRLGPHQPKNQREIDSRSVYVSNIPFKISPWKLKVLFCQGADGVPGCGSTSVNRVTIVCDRVTGLPKGYAYIEFAHESDAAAAVRFDGLQVDGRVIGVKSKRTNVPGVHSNDPAPETPLHASPDPVDTPATHSHKNSDFYNSDSAKNFKNHRNSNYNFIKNANNLFGHRRHRAPGATKAPATTMASASASAGPKSPAYSPANTAELAPSSPAEVHSTPNGCRNNHPSPHPGSRGRGHVRGHFRGRLRGGPQHTHSNTPSKSNSNLRHPHHNGSGTSTNTSSSNAATSNSKLVIDKYHYLTPSSRVGVYNSDGDGGTHSSTTVHRANEL